MPRSFLPQRAGRRLLAAAFTASCLLPATGARPSASGPAGEVSPDGCRGSWTDPITLRTADGRVVYVDGAQVLPLQDRLLLLGNYALLLDLSSDSVGVFRSGIIGAFVDSGGLATPVQTPVPGQRIHFPHAVGDDSGRVHMVWGASDDTSAVPNTLTRLRYSSFDGQRWTPPETITEHQSIEWIPASSIRYHEGDLLLAVPATTRAPRRHVALMLRRSDGRWTERVLERWTFLAYADVLQLPGGRLVAALVEPVRDSLPDHNSLLVLVSTDTGRTWTSPVRLHAGGVREAHQPRFVKAADDIVFLLWQSRQSGQPAYDSVLLWQSVDQGRTWTSAGGALVRGGILGTPGSALADSSGAIDVVLATAEGGRLWHAAWYGGRWLICAAPPVAAMGGHEVMVVGARRVLVWGTVDRHDRGTRHLVSRMAWLRP